MSSETVIPIEGTNWIADRATGQSEELGYITVGTGTGSVAHDDTELDAPVHEEPIEDGDATASRGTGDGEIACSVTVVGGIDVAAGTEVTEIGLFTTNNRLVYREVRDGVLIEDVQRVTLQFSVEITGEIRTV